MEKHRENMGANVRGQAAAPFATHRQLNCLARFCSQGRVSAQDVELIGRYWPYLSRDEAMSVIMRSSSAPPLTHPSATLRMSRQDAVALGFSNAAPRRQVCGTARLRQVILLCAEGRVSDGIVEQIRRHMPYIPRRLAQDAILCARVCKPGDFESARLEVGQSQARAFFSDSALPRHDSATAPQLALISSLAAAGRIPDMFASHIFSGWPKISYLLAADCIRSCARVEPLSFPCVFIEPLRWCDEDEIPYRFLADRQPYSELCRLVARNNIDASVEALRGFARLTWHDMAYMCSVLRMHAHSPYLSAMRPRSPEELGGIICSMSCSHAPRFSPPAIMCAQGPEKAQAGRHALVRP